MLRRYVLIFHAGALGDFLLTWPLAMALGRLHPRSRIVYVTHAAKGALAERVLGVESTDMETGWHSLFSEDATLPEKPLKLLTGAHTIFSFLSSGQDVWAQNVARLDPDAKSTFLSPRPPAGFAGHFTDYLLEQLRPLPATWSATDQMLRSILERGLGGPRQDDRKTILLHPGSGSPEKNWPVDRFVELAAKLKAKSLNVRFIVGEVEQERFAEDEVKRMADTAEVVHLSAYLELLDILKSAHGFIGNDSGPSHLSGLLAVPTLTLFGPTNPKTWRPLGPRVHTLLHQPLSELTVAAVMASASTWFRLP